jgi:hypothetical protein
MAFLHKLQRVFLVGSQNSANVNQNAANVEVTFATKNRGGGKKFKFATFTELV